MITKPTQSFAAIHHNRELQFNFLLFLKNHLLSICPL